MSMSDYTTLPQGLIAAVTRIVNRYTSAEPIGRGELVSLVRRAGFDVTERTVREAIKQARRLGTLLLSAPGTNGGYFAARDMGEYEAFDRTEYGAKIADMAETRAAMRRAAEREFGAVEQMRWF